MHVRVVTAGRVDVKRANAVSTSIREVKERMSRRPSAVKYSVVCALKSL